eukprot:TRINITY_DN2443_c0_g1_i1.p1 TRINITY_DN2443_c0_g1~~TRINITY_DN2443_c0_g1_i1.p1  ORF type:complete len:109 (+),score=8.99 TRINITY_DN2443_c0_g1_i1:428-754(+)
MQYLRKCQLVRGMHYTPVELTWATEARHRSVFESVFIELEMNTYTRVENLPDGYYGQDYISIYYCFYQPTVIDAHQSPDSRDKMIPLPDISSHRLFPDGYVPVSMDYV